MLKRNKYCEPISLENIYWLIWYMLYLYMLLIRFDASPKMLFVSFHYHVLFCFFREAAMLFQVNAAKIRYF